MSNPFVYLKAINNKENIIHDDLDEKGYEPFLMNRSLSYFPDTVLLANEMNLASHIDSKLQNDFLINTIRKNIWDKSKMSEAAKLELNL